MSRLLARLTGGYDWRLVAFAGVAVVCGLVATQARNAAVFWLLGAAAAILGMCIIRGFGEERLSERLRTQNHELERTKAFLNTVIDSVPATIVVKDPVDLHYVLVNSAAEQLFAIPRDQMTGKVAHDLFPKNIADSEVAGDLEVIRSGYQVLREERLIDTPGSGRRIVTSSRIPVFDHAGKPAYLLRIIEDVTERKREAARVERMRHYDLLTDLPNRATVMESLVQMIEQAQTTGESFAVICLDLDRFKEVNDVFGHAIGDKLLIQVARRLEEACQGAFLARYGGDEFVVVSPTGPQPSSAQALADRLATAADNIDIDGQPVRVALTMGAAFCPGDGTDPATLLANADAALYRAKVEARGSLRFFHSEMDKQLRENRSLQHELGSAIERNELFLHYEPLARADGEVVGFEALARWRHPIRGMIPPGMFIPLAEESSLIIQLGEWIMREACREAASWPKPLRIAINLSPVQFQHGDLVALVHTVLLETGLSANRLELEITEGVLINDFSRALATLRRLKAFGVRVAMDDFGKGYSSLSYLQAFPFDKIKIDQGFIAHFERPQSAAIIRAVIGLGRGLGLPVVAEGVETIAQLEFLTREECSEVQGFLIGPPAPIEVYADMVGRVATPEQELKLLAG